MSSKVQVWFAFVMKVRRQTHERNSKGGTCGDLLGVIKAGGFVSVHAAAEANQGLRSAVAGRLKDYAQQLACCTHSST